jgi:GNAT superfamily N-acetyltransferase
MQAIVKSGEVPGILAYEGDKPVGWCSVAPRSSFPVLNRSRILKKIDDEPVWSVVCFFIDKGHRNRGLSVRLLRAAVDYARQRGGALLEGYPVEPRKGVMPPAFAWTGLASAFRKAGFSEVARRSETRPMMRFTVSRGRRKTQ